VASTAAGLAELFGTTVDEIVTRTNRTARSLLGA
jgi:hypothetical protein